ncbi:energy-coupling factor ABC transporter ATP-binding protein [Providencia rettgeri]|uniref:energy-coupling factor ABC transporter ATP-binding protein n=1 Tax=Providencia TaxID=586 RepID=UPI00226D9C2B|nr:MULTISPECIES: ABC transporter ATP-binding protein [Providencia]MCX9123753.1 energy-coupling factor ABC transporter ATP-binding protein [Providencia rettgeri]MCX9128691.1 energy-coupling factor ABC transporter ATP-binding protein [Providencia rettgeri]HEM6844121.1 ABC transporter ATP-binding protein [Providencia rettgeri]
MVVNLQQMRFIPQSAEQSLLGPIDLQLNAGQWLCVFGGNGSGKSTLAQILAGWHSDLIQGKIEGTAEVLQAPLADSSVVQVSISRQLVQQSPQLQLSGCAFTVEQEIAFGPENLGLSPSEISERVEDAIALTFCEALRKRHPATLSGGEAQRVVLASALAMQPKLLLLDEAFSRLTPSATQRILAQLQHYTEHTNCSIIFFERNLLPAISFCDSFLLLSTGKAFLDSGKVVATGCLDDVFLDTIETINMPEAWRAIGELAQLGHWRETIPHNEAQLLQMFKERNVTD